MKSITTLSLTILTLLLAVSASARPPWPDYGLAPEDRIERRIEVMAEQLDLTAEQQAEMREILEAQALKRREERATVDARIDDVLSAEQRAMRDEQLARRVERRVARFAERLDLSAEQESELLRLMMGSNDPAEWNGDAMREQLAAVLTAQQLAQLDGLRASRGHPGRTGCMR